MNVLFLTRRFYPEIGGVEKHVLEISKALVRRGSKVTVITEEPAFNYHSKDQSDTYSINSKKAAKSIQTDNYEAKNIKVVRLESGKNDWFKKFRIWANLLRCVTLIREADVVHCHDVFFWYLPFRFLFPTKKVYITFHGYETKFPPTLKAKIIRKISERMSHGNICVGDYIKKWYGTKPSYITYGGVSPVENSKVIKETILEKFNYDRKRRKKVNILLIGRLEEDNGIKIYKEALRKLRKQKVPYNLEVCGDGRLKQILTKYGRIKGFVDNLDKYIVRSDFIFTSSYLSILEAISRGKKVFSVAQNDLKRDYLELSPFSKFISISNSSDELVRDINKYMDGNIKSYNNIQSARNWARGQTWESVSDIYIKLWKL